MSVRPLPAVCSKVLGILYAMFAVPLFPVKGIASSLRGQNVRTAHPNQSRGHNNIARPAVRLCPNRTADAAHYLVCSCAFSVRLPLCRCTEHNHLYRADNLL